MVVSLFRPELQTPGTGGADAAVTPQPAPAASDKPEITSTTAEATTQESSTVDESNATTEDKDQDTTANDSAGKPAVALFDFEPNAEDELQLKAGKFCLDSEQPSSFL